MGLSFKHRILSLVTHPLFGMTVIFLTAVIISIQNYTMGAQVFWEHSYTHYNNFIIFKQSFFHLLHKQDLYIRHANDYADYYKYSPTFALCMGLIAWLPNLPGLISWNLINCFVFYFAVKKIRHFNQNNFLFIMSFVLLEIVVSLMASQSNLLVAGLIIFAFNKLEAGKPGSAAFLIVSGIFIKLFVVLAALLFIFYPKKIQFVAYMIGWGLLFLIAPLLIITTELLIHQYQSWYYRLAYDLSISSGVSIYTVIETLTGYVNKNMILISGALLILLPLVKTKSYCNYSFRIWYLSLILIWIIIFNHKGESPGYVIALAGCAIWATATQASLSLKVVLFLTWFFSSFIKSDVFPQFVRDALYLDFTNAFMTSVVFVLMVFSMLFPSRFFSYQLKNNTSED